MYPKGCKKTSSGGTFSTNGVLKILKDGATVATTYVYDSDNYGFVNQNFTAGNYTALFQATWHSTDDVKDYTLRAYMKSPIIIT